MRFSNGQLCKFTAITQLTICGTAIAQILIRLYNTPKQGNLGGIIMKLARVLFALVAILAMTGTSHAWFLDFEWGLGNDGGVIASGVPGLQFTTTDGQDWRYADITTDGYNVTSDNGSSYGTGNWNMSGDVFAWLGTSQGSGRIDFLNQDGSFFSTGYSSAHTFYLEAYDAGGALLDQAIGAANTQADGGTSLDYLTVSSMAGNIAYVMVHDQGNFFLVDNMRGDASAVYDPSIPEPATLALFGLGLLGAGARLRKRMIK